jgi:hypothetical protein
MREDFGELYTLSCPECDRTLVLVSYPTVEETRVAAREGNPEAALTSKVDDERELFLARAKESRLSSPGQLPELEGEDLVIEWDFEEDAGDEHGYGWTVLRIEGREIWRSIALYEGYEQFAEVLGILRERYGERLMDLRPTRNSHDYLFGDSLSAAGKIEALRASLVRKEGSG